ncbi:hypothetical protein EDD86DRAFT_197454 [Gorgonomyces haynaldii]|nr:hypothetical protein EDD86DRAFT_197454 [Gorgonomyces haynaldii]
MDTHSKLYHTILFQQQLPPLNYQIEPPMYVNSMSTQTLLLSRILNQRELIVEDNPWIYQTELLMFRYLISSGLLITKLDRSWLLDNLQPQRKCDLQGLVLVQVHEAQQLLAKDTRYSNNPFVCVHHMGVQYRSQHISQTLNPMFQFSILLPQTDDQIHISLWNKPTKQTKQAFLGLITLQPTLYVKDQWFQLGKRTRKSHVAGQIKVSLTRVTKDNLEEWMFKCFPLDPTRDYRVLVESCIQYDYNQNAPKSLFSSPIESLLSDIRRLWCISPEFDQLLMFEKFKDLFFNGLLSAVQFKHQVFDPAIKILQGQIFELQCLSLYHMLEDNIKTFFNTNQRTGEDLVSMCNMLSDLFQLQFLNTQKSDPVLTTKEALVVAFHNRYHGLLAIANDKKEEVPLVSLVESISDELESYCKTLDTMLFGVIHVPSLASSIFFGPLSVSLDQFSSNYQSRSPEMMDAFDLYKAVRRLQKVCESIDFRLADRFPMTKWFKAFVRDWLYNSGSRILGWVKASIEYDKCERISTLVPYSTSVLDVFTSSQQLIDQVKDLSWPNEKEAQLFFFRLLHQVLEGLVSYCQLSIKLLEQDLQQMRTLHQALPRKAAKIGKLKVKLPELKKKPQIVDETCARLTSKVCVRFLNITALTEQYDALCKQVPTMNDPNTSTDDQLFYGDPRLILRLRIVQALDFNISRPWNLKMAVRVSTNAGRELGKTRWISQSANAVWDEYLYSVMGQKEANGGLMFSMLHMIDGQKEYHYATGELQVQMIQTMMMTGGVHETRVRFGDYGHVKVEIEVSNREEIQILQQMVRWLTKQTTDKMTNMFIDQLCYDLRDRVHPITLNYKENKLQRFFSKVMNDPKPEDLTQEERDEIESNLSLIFEFLNVNLEVLTSHMEEQFSLEIVKGIWQRFVQVSEQMVVPSLGEDPKERKPWDERRIMFFMQYLDAAQAFFRPAEDEGLTKEQLEHREYLDLLMMLKHYHQPKQELLDVYQASKYSDWILKLLKMKGLGDFVNAELRDRCQQ